MQKYTDVVQNRLGLAVEGAKVLVTDINGSVATIFSNNGTTQQANPMTTNANGRFAFYAADGRYNLTVTINNVQYGEQRDILLNDPADPSPEKIDGGVIVNSQVNESEVNNCTITGGTAQQVTVTGSTISQSELEDVTIDGLPPMTVGGQEHHELVEDVQQLTAQSREALRRSYADAGYNLVDGSFEEGGVLTSTDDVMITASGYGYSWGGTYPVGGYSVAPGTDPTSVGSEYVPRTVAVLRNELANENSDVLISGVQAGKIQRNINGVKELPSTATLDGASFMLRGFYPTNDIGGGELRYDSSKSKALHNGGTVIAPEAIAAWDGTLTNINQLLGWTGTGTGCYVRTSREIDPAMFGAVDDINQNSTKPSQAAIYACAAANWRKMTLSGNYAIFASLVVNRQVGTGEPNSYWNIVADEVGGFTCRFSGALFTSTLTQSTDGPVSQLIRFKGVNLSGDGNGTDRFILDGNKLLRICFNECTMTFIRCLNTIGTKYIQSYYFNSCNIRKCTGTFLNADVAYDLKVNAGTLIEAHDGDLFRVKTPIGCSFLGSTFEGVSGTAVDYEQAQGLAFVGMYWEGNGRDIDGSNSSGNVSYGVANIGGVHSVATLGYNVKWGPTLGGISAGNWGTDKLHEFTTQRAAIETLVQDEAQYTLANDGTIRSGGAYAGDLPLIQLRTDVSDSYTTAVTYSNFVTRDGFMDVDFVATMTSTASNPAGKLYINSGIPLNAVSTGMLCGTVVVEGAGHSPCTVFNAVPCRVLSVDSIVPAMGNGVSKQVSGQIRYKFTV